MKIQLFALLVACGAFAAVQVVDAQNPQCYCAYKCGPRDVVKGDAPFIDQATSICFCQERDLKRWNQGFCHNDYHRAKTFANSACRK